MSECLDRCTKLSVFFVLLIFLTSIHTSPLVLDDASSCSYNKIGKYYFFSNNLWSTSKEDVTVHFNLCDKLPDDICGDNVNACVKHKNGTVLVKGNLDFRVDAPLGSQQDIIFHLSNENRKGEAVVGEKILDIEIKEACSEFEDGLKMKIEKGGNGSIVYRVDMNDPTCPCTIRIKEKHLDLRPIKGIYSVQSPLKNFSISLCRSNELCNGTDVTACIIEGSKTVPLSDASQEILEYQERENQVIVKGKYRKHGIKFELRLQCNWIMTNPKVSYIIPQSLGKNYRFLMESSQACIIKNPQCEFPSSFAEYYYYNLSTLNNVDGYKVGNVSTGSHMYINPCGRLKFGGKRNFCTDTYSQICEVTGNNYFNKGSILQNYEARAADLSITYASGIRCKSNDTKQYQTHISFMCSTLNENPKVVDSDECNLYIKWKTPEACLKAKKDACDQIRVPPPHSCTVEHDGDIYDLSKLSKENSSYVLQDKDDPSIEYLLNVCTSVVDDETACTKGASVILKNSSEPDIRKRVMLLGKMNSLSMVNEKLIIEATNGHGCNSGENSSKSSSGEYSSKIIFVCSEKEETPILMKKTKCNFEFVFKTKYACENQTLAAEGAECRFKHPSTAYRINFNKSEPSILEVMQKNISYYFNICKTEPQAKCSGGECLYLQPKRFLFVHEGKKYLDFQLNRSCHSSDEFNRTLIELRCDTGIENNDSSKKWRIENCILYLPLFTSKACSNNINTDDQSDARKIEKTRYSIGEININDNLTKYKANESGIGANTKFPMKNTDDMPKKKEEFSMEVNTKIPTKNTDVSKKKEEFSDGVNIKSPRENTDISKEKKKFDVEVTTQSPMENTGVAKEKLNCASFIKNNYTGYTFNISSLKLQVEVTGCPSIAMNYSNNSVSIVYPTHNLCLNVKSTDSKYNVLMKCVPDSDTKIVKDVCDQIIVNRPEACKLLERAPTSASYSSAAVAGISIAVILILAAIATVSVLAYVKVFRKRRSYGTISYEKVKTHLS